MTIKHIEIAIDFDLTCEGVNIDDFPEGDNILCAKEEIDDYFFASYNIPELLDKVKIAAGV